VERLVAHRVIADKFRLDRALAAGGMGSVWAAWNTHLDVPVAVKLMAPPLAASQELVARFEREARAAAQIRSPHVVQIFEHGIHDGLPFIVMELLEGEDLGARMRRRGRLSLEETAHVVRGVCRALRRAHAMGIVHRDLKPANVFLAQCGDDDEEEIVKVLDFGVVKSLAEAVDSGVTKTGELIGTPSYMSPEQARNTRGVDHRSDLWSLGIITHRALTGSLPFPAEEGLNRLMRICSERIPPPSSLHADLGPEVDEFFVRALSIDPDERFQTAREMSDAMSALAGLPASSSVPGRGSVGDGGPPSSSMYTAHAYVYTSAPESGDAAAIGHQGPPSAPRPEAGGKAAGGGERTSDSGSITDVPTRVSNFTRPGGTRLATKRAVAIVAGSAGDASGPVPSLSPEDLGEASTAGLARSPSTAARLLIAPPRMAVGAGVGLLVALGAVLSVLLSSAVSEEAGAHTAGAPAKILFATTAVSIQLPASATVDATVPAPLHGSPSAPVALPPASAGETAAPAASPTAPVASTTARASDADAASAAVAASAQAQAGEPRPAVSPPAWKTGGKPWSWGTSIRRRTPAPSKPREGGAGRRGMY
jgi:serine/threonine protein kinase